MLIVSVQAHAAKAELDGLMDEINIIKKEREQIEREIKVASDDGQFIHKLRIFWNNYNTGFDFM